MTVDERVFKALANRRRLQVVRYLKRHREASVGELAALLRVSFPTVSKHLSVLAAADIVEYERRNIMVYYRLSAELPSLVSSILKHL